MKIIITTNEILTTARTFNTFPGIFKGFISDEKILKEFYTELRVAADKTTAFTVEINMETVTIDIKEEFYIELINEFGGMINGICSIVMGAGASIKRIGDKYKK